MRSDQIRPGRTYAGQLTSAKPRKVERIEGGRAVYSIAGVMSFFPLSDSIEHFAHWAAREVPVSELEPTHSRKI